LPRNKVATLLGISTDAWIDRFADWLIIEGLLQPKQKKLSFENDSNKHIIKKIGGLAYDVYTSYK
jgi:hypothetical protein